MKKIIAVAFATTAALALAACGTKEETAETEAAGNVEMPAEEAVPADTMATGAADVTAPAAAEAAGAAAAAGEAAAKAEGAADAAAANADAAKAAAEGAEKKM